MIARRRLALLALVAIAWASGCNSTRPGLFGRRTEPCGGPELSMPVSAGPVVMDPASCPPGAIPAPAGTYAPPPGTYPQQPGTFAPPPNPALPTGPPPRQVPLPQGSPQTYVPGAVSRNGR